MSLSKYALAAGVILCSLIAYAQSADMATLAANIEDILDSCDKSSSFDFDRVYFDDNYELVIAYPTQAGAMQFGTVRTEVPMSEVSVEFGGGIKFTCHRPGCIKEVLAPTPIYHNGRVQSRTRFILSDCDLQSTEDAIPALQKLSELLSNR